MLQSEYEHLYDDITVTNIHLMKKQPIGSVVIERYDDEGEFIGRNPFNRPDSYIKMHSYKVHTSAGSFYYKSIGDGKILYTENNKPSVFRLP